MPAGRPRKPTAIKQAEGNPGKRPLNTREPKPSRVLGLKCPKWMGEHGKAEWKRITPELARLGLLTLIDQAALELYCCNYDNAVTNYLRMLGKKGDRKTEDGKDLDIFTADTGYQQPTAAFAMFKQSCEQARKLLVEFGLSPAARTRLEVEVPKSESNTKTSRDDFEGYLD